MSLENAIADIMCQTYSRRPSRKTAGGFQEYDWAETAAYIQFEKDFKSRHKGGIVLNQLTYKLITTPTDTDIQFVLEALQEDFKNWWSSTNMSREGGYRKPDGLGISPGARIIELIEVKPYHSYQAGVTQLNEMISLIDFSLRAHYDKKSLREGMSPSYNPNYAVTIKGSPWKFSNDGLTIPLPVDAATGEIAWICFRPTLRQAGVDGVVLYEIHNIEKNRYQQKIPDDVAKRLKEAYERQRKANTWSPFAQEYARSNPQDAELIKNLTIAIGVVAVVALIVVVVVYAAPVVLAATEGVVAAETTTVLVGGSYRIAPLLIRVAVEQKEAVEFAEEVVNVSQKMVR